MSNTAAIEQRQRAAASSVPLAAPKARRALRFALLGLVPALALGGGFYWWLSGGRYVATDNAYVGADKVLVTPQVSGPILAVHVAEGQRVRQGDPLFDVDPAPYRTALALARAHQSAARSAFVNLQTSYASNLDQIKMGAQAVELRQQDYDRKSGLLSTHSGTRADVDVAAAALIQAKQILTFVKEQQNATLVKLGGAVDSPIEAFPEFVEARAQVEDAQRNVEKAAVAAPIAGVATQVNQVQLGRVAPAGTPVFAIVGDEKFWIDVNPKESDMGDLRVGLPASVTIDAFPDRRWQGKICSIAPGTGAQFSLIPAQNASGNWVKVVQRVPLRVCLDAAEDLSGLRAGMSAYVAIDTGKQRSLAALVGGLFGAKAQAKP